MNNFDPMYVINKFTTEQINKTQQIANSISERQRNKDAIEIETLEVIKEIRDAMPDIINLIRVNNEINIGLFELYQEMNKIMVSNTKEEAENIFFTVITKSKDIKDGIDAATGLFTYGKALILQVFGVGE
jgi:hypothetical protein